MDVEEEEEEEIVRRMVLRRKADPKTGKHTLREPAQSKCTWTFHKSRFAWIFAGKVPDAYPKRGILCEPATRTWTFQKSHPVWKFTFVWKFTR